MKTLTKRFATAVLFLLCLFSFVGVGVVNADGTALKDRVTDFTIVQAAQIRTQAPSGVRFMAKVNKDQYDKLGANAKMGMLVAPANLIPEGEELELDTVLKNNAPIANIEKIVWGEDSTTTEYTFKAVITNIYESNLNRDFVARAYITLDGDTIYTDSVTRSPVYVATGSIAKGETADLSYYFKGLPENGDITTSIADTVYLAKGETLDFDTFYAGIKVVPTVTVDGAVIGLNTATTRTDDLVALSAGETVVTLTVNGVEKQINVVVKDYSITLPGKNHIGMVGKTTILPFVVTDNGAEIANANVVLSGNPDQVVVDGNSFKPLVVGKLKLTATYTGSNGISATLPVDIDVADRETVINGMKEYLAENELFELNGDANKYGFRMIEDTTITAYKGNISKIQEHNADSYGQIQFYPKDYSKPVGLSIEFPVKNVYTKSYIEIPLLANGNGAVVYVYKYGQTEGDPVYTANLGQQNIFHKHQVPVAGLLNDEGVLEGIQVLLLLPSARYGAVCNGTSMPIRYVTLAEKVDPYIAEGHFIDWSDDKPFQLFSATTIPEYTSVVTSSSKVVTGYGYNYWSGDENNMVGFNIEFTKKDVYDTNGYVAIRVLTQRHSNAYIYKYNETDSTAIVTSAATTANTPKTIYVPIKSLLNGQNKLDGVQVILDLKGSSTLAQGFIYEIKYATESEYITNSVSSALGTDELVNWKSELQTRLVTDSTIAEYAGGVDFNNAGTSFEAGNKYRIQFTKTTLAGVNIEFAKKLTNPTGYLEIKIAIQTAWPADQIYVAKFGETNSANIKLIGDSTSNWALVTVYAPVEDLVDSNNVLQGVQLIISSNANKVDFHSIKLVAEIPA